MSDQKNPEDIRYTYSFPDHSVVLAADSKRHGVVAIQPEGTAVNLIREPYFGLNVYRLLNEGQLMAIARAEPFQVAERTSTLLSLDWETTTAHPVKLDVSYELKDAATIDFKLSATAQQALQSYEISISSYFDFSMEPYAVISAKAPGTDGEQLLLKVEDHPYIKGYYVCFPRDARTAHLRTDGRWRDGRTGQMIAHHVFGPYYGLPIAIMANQDHYIVQMSEATHCNGIDTTYSSEDKKDNIMLHNALYFNLFGDSFQAGEQRTARIRQVLCQGEVNLEKILTLYDQFLASLSSDVE